MGVPAAEVWIDAIHIYSVTADKKDLAGTGFFSFMGFLYRRFRDHDYDLGRQKAQAFLSALSQISLGKLPRLRYAPRPIHPVARQN